MDVRDACLRLLLRAVQRVDLLLLALERDLRLLDQPQAEPEPLGPGLGVLPVAPALRLLAAEVAAVRALQLGRRDDVDPHHAVLLARDLIRHVAG